MTTSTSRPPAARRRLGVLLAALVVLGTALVATSAGAQPSGTQVVLVRTHGGDVEEAAALLASFGGVPMPALEAVGVASAVVAADVPARLAAHPRVAHVELDRPVRLHLATSQRAVRSDEVVGGRLPGGGTLDGSGVGIAVIDSGVDGTHPFLQAGARSKVVVNRRNTCSSPVTVTAARPDADSCFRPAPGNDSDTGAAGGHGTHVAGIAVGGPVVVGGERLVGTAPGAELTVLSVGVGPTVLSSNLALQWVLNHHADPCGNGTCAPIRVVNNSFGELGGGEFDPESSTVQLQRALVREGVTVVWAVGNDGGDASEDRTNPPAKDPTLGVIGVANYDDDDRGTRDGAVAASSSRGDRDDAMTWPDLSAPGTRIRSSCRATLSGCTDLGFGSYSEISGTSMAAPHVAGAVALLVQADPSITPAQVERVLLTSAHRFGGGQPYIAQDPRAVGTGPTAPDKGHGLLDVAAALASVTPLVEPPPPTVDPDVTRVSGPDRIATAARLSAATFATAGTVVLARADQYADALAGGPLAATLRGPLLLSSSSRLSGATRDEVVRLGAETAVLLGGTGALSEQVERDLADLGLDVRRVRGRDRFATATAIADAVADANTQVLGGEGLADVWVVEGRNPDPSRGWPDAVSAGAAAARATVGGAPQAVLLVTRDAVPAATVAWLRDNTVDAVVVGGTGAVSREVEQSIDDLAGTVERVAGPDRYATATLVARRAVASGDPSRVYVATGGAFPDALGAGPAAAARDGVLVLTRRDRLPDVVDELLAELAPLDAAVVVGGRAAVSDGVLVQLSRHV